MGGILNAPRHRYFGPPVVERQHASAARCTKELAMQLCMLTITGVVSLSFATPTAAQDNAAIQKAAEDKAINLCSTCHGPRGISTSPEFPILAAQNRAYLENQIEAFRKRTRSEKDAHDF